MQTVIPTICSGFKCWQRPVGAYQTMQVFMKTEAWNLPGLLIPQAWPRKKSTRKTTA